MALLETHLGRNPWQFWRRRLGASTTPKALSEEVTHSIVDVVQEGYQIELQRWREREIASLTEEWARNYQAEKQRESQKAVEAWVTNGVEYRPSPLLDQVREITLTPDGQEDLLTVHAHLAAMNMGKAIREGKDPGTARAALNDAIYVFQNARRHPLGGYVRYPAMMRHLTEEPLNRRAAERSLNYLACFVLQELG